IVCRAFTDLEHFRQLASPLLSTDGQLLAMKGKEKDLYRRVSEAVKANTQATSWQVHPVQLPGVDKERHICIHTALRSHSGEG
ncbi:MAG: class I SAM-dependent methyltransferase, partial [Gammaproteobacteria bacterium]|nr:class I SAM-dependent methyltransferase [Gammaproteobacteria bacterium]